MLRAELEVSQEYDSNAFDRERNVQSDLLTALTPRLDFAMRGETGIVELGLGGRYKRYWEFQERNGFDPFAELRVSRRISPKLIFTLNGSFRERSTIDDILDDQFVVNGDEIEQSRQTLLGESPSVRTQDLGAGFRYQLTPVQELTFNASVGDTSHDRLGFDPIVPRIQPRDTNRSSFSIGYERSLTVRDRLGIGLSRQKFQTEGSDPRDPPTQTPRTAREDEILAVTANWTRQWTPRLSTGFRGGVRLLDPEGGEVPGLVLLLFDPNGRALPSPADTSSDSSTGFVGSFDLQYRTLMDSFALGYTRETRPQSGSSGSLDVDRILITYSRAIGRRFNLSFRARYERSQSASEALQVFSIGSRFLPFPSTELSPAGLNCLRAGGSFGFVGPRDQCVLSGKNEFDRTDKGVGATFSWRIRSNLTTLVSYDFLTLEIKGPNRPSYDDHRVRIGLSYDYEIDLF